MIALGSLMQANSWMQWLHNLRQSFSSQAFIAHMWEGRKRRGGHWKREATSHGRYSSHFLLAAHLTSACAPSQTWEASSDREVGVRKGMKGLLMRVISHVPPDVQELLQKELEIMVLDLGTWTFCILFLVL